MLRCSLPGRPNALVRRPRAEVTLGDATIHHNQPDVERMDSICRRTTWLTLDLLGSPVKTVVPSPVVSQESTEF